NLLIDGNLSILVNSKKMASISASISTSSPTFTLVQKPSITTCGSPVIGLPSMSKMGKVRCSMEGKPAVTSEEVAPKLRMGAPSLMAAAVAATMSVSAASIITPSCWVKVLRTRVSAPFWNRNLNLLGCFPVELSSANGVSVSIPKCG
ncbi:hypothetical protein EHS17_15505, partial [Rhodobacteraceae bacterium CH30]